MTNNQTLIESLARQLPKIDVCGVCPVWDAIEPKKTNTFVPKLTDADSCLKDVCGVWKSEETLIVQTHQTSHNQYGVWSELRQDISKTAMFEDRKEFQTRQTHQISENDNTHKKNVVVNESAPQVSLSAIDLIPYIDYYNERAAIFQYEGGLTKAEAEYNAYLETLNEFVATMYSDILNVFELIIYEKPS